VTPQATSVILMLRTGKMIELPRTSSGMTDFSGVNPCHRCGTGPRRDGSLPSSGGILRVYAIHRGIWTAYAGACDCVFGAFRVIERNTNEGQIPPMRYVDTIPGVPPGLTNDEWTMLNLFKHQGDGFLDAAKRIPADTADLGEMLGILEHWERKEA